MAKAPRENRIPIMMSNEELTAIDDWRFANRVATRSEAVRRLCKIGLIFDDASDDVSQQVFQLFLVTSVLGETLANWRDSLPNEAQEAFEPSVRIMAEQMDRIAHLYADFEQAANSAQPYRSSPDMDQAARDAALAKVEASNWRDELFSGTDAPVGSILDDLETDEKK
ncbi:hypothetical protein [Devosia sp. A369]